MKHFQEKIVTGIDLIHKYLTALLGAQFINVTSLAGQGGNPRRRDMRRDVFYARCWWKPA